MALDRLIRILYLRGASGSIPRSILAIRSWCLSTITVIAIAPPTITETIGISNGPKLMIHSMLHLLNGFAKSSKLKARS